MKQVHCLVTGKVQGVWFRVWTRDLALELGLDGWVRNTVSGQVEAVAQGAGDEVELFVERLHEGPPLARVTSVETSWSEVVEAMDGFSVRHDSE